MAVGLAPTLAKDRHPLVAVSLLLSFAVFSATFFLFSMAVTLMWFLSVDPSRPVTGSISSPEESPVMDWESTRRSPPFNITSPSILAVLVDET